MMNNDEDELMLLAEAILEDDEDEDTSFCDACGGGFNGIYDQY